VLRKPWPVDSVLELTSPDARAKEDWPLLPGGVWGGGALYPLRQPAAALSWEGCCGLQPPRQSGVVPLFGCNEDWRGEPFCCSMIQAGKIEARSPKRINLPIYRCELVK
jgi:hypothetical protein